MADVVFYGKPGCINNTKQKKMLRDAGHVVDDRNLLTEGWCSEVLIEYFNHLQVSKWFNVTAQDVKSGKIDPSGLTRDQAIELMIENPLLIRRPLIKANNECRVGFDAGDINDWIGLGSAAGNEDIETCQKPSGQGCLTPDRLKE